MSHDVNDGPRSSAAGEAHNLSRPILNNAPKSVAQAAPDFKRAERVRQLEAERDDLYAMRAKALSERHDARRRLAWAERRLRKVDAALRKIAPDRWWADQEARAGCARMADLLVLLTQPPRRRRRLGAASA